MLKPIIGDIKDIVEGATFINRVALRNANIHLPLQSGIDGNSLLGASSIVLSGGYIDDVDQGEEIIYTGHGGNKLNTKIQIKDQSWESVGNKALLVSATQGYPIRVTSGHTHKSDYSPRTGYQYGGLYFITNYFQEYGRSGFLICRFVLKKVDPLKLIDFNGKILLPVGNDNTERVATTTLRIIRDTKLSQQLKRLYDYTCQICNLRISLNGVGYSEAAHIRPLGNPHNGGDSSANLICLCPNHHVMFDKGIFSINEDFSLIGIKGNLNYEKSHIIGSINLLYHKEHIYINTH